MPGASNGSGLKGFIMAEHDEQVAYFTWIRSYEAQYPLLKNIIAIPNAGKREGYQGQWMVDEGLRAGVWDIFLAIPTDDAPGAWIEMKFGRNPLTDSQREWGEQQIELGYQMIVCWTWLEAVSFTCKYLGLPADIDPTTDIPVKLRRQPKLKL